MGKVNFVMIKELDEKKIFCKPEVCKTCKGEGCCKNCGCVFSPDDFYIFNHQFSEEERFQYLKHFLKKGYASIDHKWLKNKSSGAFKTSGGFPLQISFEKLLDREGALYIRMRNEGKGIVDVVHLHFDIPVGCVGLTEKGCRFSFKNRPKGGRMVIPDTSGAMDCTVIYSEHHAAIDWYPYQAILYRLYQEFR